MARGEVMGAGESSTTLPECFSAHPLHQLMAFQATDFVGVSSELDWARTVRS
jgi:hypothetical protein